MQRLEYNSDAMTIFSKVGSNILQNFHVISRRKDIEGIVHLNISADYYKPCFVVLSLYRKNA